MEQHGPTGSRYGPQGHRLTTPNARRTTAPRIAVGTAILADPTGFGAGGAV